MKDGLRADTNPYVDQSPYSDHLNQTVSGLVKAGGWGQGVAF